MMQIFVVGSAFSGKSSLIKKYKTDLFIESSEQPTIQIKFSKETLKIDGKEYITELYDTQGFDANPGVLKIPQYKRSKGFIIVFDLTSKGSFENAIKCWEEIKSYCPIQNQHAVLLGNKKDLTQERKVSRDQAEQFCENQGLQYKEVSAKTDSQQKLKKIFQNRVKLLASKCIAEKNLRDDEKKQKENIKLKNQKKKQQKNESGSCCQLI